MDGLIPEDWVFGNGDSHLHVRAARTLLTGCGGSLLSNFPPSLLYEMTPFPLLTRGIDGFG